MERYSSFAFDVPRPERLSRLLIFVKWLLVFPHAFILSIFGFVANIVGFIAWWTILIFGSYPEELWRLVYSYVRWNARVSVYVSLLRDEYPPFGDGPYPVQFQLERPQRQSRLLLFVRIVAVIPLALWLSLVGIWAAILSIAAFFAILFTGNIPEGIFDWLVRFMRYSLRITVYTLMLTDEWPGFTLD